MKKKFKNKIFYSCLIGTSVISLLACNKVHFKNEVNNHASKGMVHSGKIISHRGFSSKEIDNSLSSLSVGFNSDCSDGVEIDIRYTKDGNIILSHDSKINDSKIENTNLSDLDKKKNKCKKEAFFYPFSKLLFSSDGLLSFDRYNEKKDKKEEYITLDDVINNYNENKYLLIDIKFADENYIEFIDKINDSLGSINNKSKIILQSSDNKKLSEMKKRYSEYKYQILIDSSKDLRKLQNEYEMFGIRKDVITKKNIEELLNKNKEVSVWTITSKRNYDNLEDRISGYLDDVFLITDCPDEICYLYNSDEDKKLTKKNQ